MAVSFATDSMKLERSRRHALTGVQLAIDGQTLSNSAIRGPTAAASGANYVGTFGPLTAGVHKYVITTTDKLGNTTTLSGQFTVPASSSNAPRTNGTMSAAAVQRAAIASLAASNSVALQARLGLLDGD